MFLEQQYFLAANFGVENAIVYFQQCSDAQSTAHQPYRLLLVNMANSCDQL